MMKKVKFYKIKYKDDPKDVCRYAAHKCYIELFGWHVHFIYSDDIVKVRRSEKFLQLLGEDKGGGLAYAFVEHTFKKGDMRSFVFLPFDHETGEIAPESIVAHECFHVVYTLAEETGMKDEEASAYLLQMLVSHATIFGKEVKKVLTKTENLVT
jgi:hypothetical protein